METRDVFERYAHAREASDQFARFTAVLIAVMAALLGIATIGASRASTETILGQGRAGDISNRLEAHQIKNYINTNDSQILRILSAQHGHHAEALATARRFLSQVNTAITTRLARDVTAQESARDAAERRHHILEYAEAALQIGIVLSSASIAVGVRWLVAGSILVGIIGALLTIDGFFSVVSLHF